MLNTTTTGPLKGFVQQLYNAGQPLSDTKAIIDQILTRMGDSPAEIAIWNKAITQMYTNTQSAAEKSITSVNQLAKAIQNLPSTKYINIIEKGTSYNISAGGAASPHAAGGRIPGFGGGDIVPAMLEPGEAIVPKHLVSAVAPFLGAHRVPGFAAGGMVAPMLPPVPDPTGLALLQQQLSGLGGDVTKDTSQVSSAALTTAKAHAALIAAQGILTGDEKNIKTLDAKTAAAKALDARAAATLKAAEAAESKAKSHLTALERLPLNFKDELAVYNAKNVYNAAASQVTRDKAALAAAGRLVTTDENVLANAKTKRDQRCRELPEHATAGTQRPDGTRIGATGPEADRHAVGAVAEDPVGRRCCLLDELAAAAGDSAGDTGRGDAGSRARLGFL